MNAAVKYSLFRTLKLNYVKNMNIETFFSRQRLTVTSLQQADVTVLT